MTKRDVKHIVVGGSLGLAAFLTFWWLKNRKPAIPEIAPSQVKWELPNG
jgi:hypothetical protein